MVFTLVFTSLFMNLVSSQVRASTPSDLLSSDFAQVAEFEMPTAPSGQPENDFESSMELEEDDEVSHFFVSSVHGTSGPYQVVTGSLNLKPHFLISLSLSAETPPPRLC